MTTHELPEATHAGPSPELQAEWDRADRSYEARKTAFQITPHGDLIEALEALLDKAIHSDECFIGPDETTCVCLIGKLRATLPQCAATKPRGMLSALGRPRPWRCTRTAHPSSPDHHVFGAV